MTESTPPNAGYANEQTQRIIQTISEVLDLNDEERAILADIAGYKRLKKWTSARHAEIIVELEDEFDIEIEAEAIARLSDLSKIDAYIREAIS